MKKSVLLMVPTICAFTSTIAQTWTAAQWNAAGTADSAAYLTEMEREVVRYINLARLYPAEFAKFEVEPYLGTPKYGDYLVNSTYKKSLLRELKTRKPCAALLPAEYLFKNAQCLALEQSESGDVGHQRKRCAKGNYTECCSYGMNTARDVALQLLIDHDVTSLGHRKICLDPRYVRVGVSAQSHAKHGDCAVLEFD